MSDAALSIFLARLGGIGKFPMMPGTVATALVGIPAAYFMSLFPKIWSLPLLILIFVASCYFCERAEKALGRDDPREIVLDELVGYLVAVFGFPFTPKAILLGFLFFRIFDVLKPWPINLMNQKKGGFWVVMDDVGAGFYSYFLLWSIGLIWP